MSESYYTYERMVLPNGQFAIDHPERLTPEGEQVYLAKEIEAAFPELGIRTQADGPVFLFFTDRALTGEEKAALDSLIALHQANG